MNRDPVLRALQQFSVAEYLNPIEPEGSNMRLKLIDEARKAYTELCNERSRLAHEVAELRREVSPPGEEYVRRWYWHVSIDTTKAAFERLTRALLTTGASLEGGRHSRMKISNYDFGRGVSMLIVCRIPEGKEHEFNDIAKPIEMGPPPRVSVGTAPVPDDGHPGRLRT